VAVGEPLLTLETSKVNVEVAAEQAGRLSHNRTRPGRGCEGRRYPGILETAATPEARPCHCAAARAERAARTSGATHRRGSPGECLRARGSRHPSRPARCPRFGDRLGSVPGTGPSGKNHRSDVETYQRKSRTEVPGATPKPAVAPAPGPEGREERVKLSRRRRTIAARWWKPSTRPLCSPHSTKPT